VQVCVDEAGADCVYANAFFGNLAGHTDGERLNSALACCVVDVFSRRSGLGGSRRYVDDRSARASVSGDIRFTASRAQIIKPVTLTANILAMRAAAIASSRICVSSIAALLTNAETRPNSESHWRKSATTSASEPMSA
jgi:hypothetical protein